MTWEMAAAVAAAVAVRALLLRGRSRQQLAPAAAGVAPASVATVSGVSSRLIVVVGQPAHRAVCSHAPHAARRGALSLRRQTDRCLVHKFCLFYFVVFTHARRAL